MAFPYTVLVTTTELGSDLTWVYLHPSARRMQLSPTPVQILTERDALDALEMAREFYADGDYPFLVTCSGPRGFFRSTYLGPKDARIPEALDRKRDRLTARAY